MHTRLSGSLGLTLFAFGLSGCFVFNDLSFPQEDTGVDPGDSTVTCESGGPDQGQLPCRPLANTSRADDPGKFTLAIRDVFINQDGLELPAGLDLDGIDSSIGAASQGVGECVSQLGDANDSNFGIDNVLGVILWPALANTFNFECELEFSHRKGLGTLLINVGKWNGLPDDAQVDVFIAPAVAATHQPSWTALGYDESDVAAATEDWTWGLEEISYHYDMIDYPLDLPFVEVEPGVRPPAPCWNEGFETDDWFFAEHGAFTHLGPKVRSDSAFVVDNWLVMPLPSGASFDLYSMIRSVQVRLVDAYLLIKLAPGATHSERAFAAGRFTVDDIDEVSPWIGFCDSQRPGYETVADLFAQPDRDDAPPGTPCVWKEDEGETVRDSGAISVGVGFSAVKVSYGGRAGAAAAWPPPNACDIFGTAPTHPPDECPGSGRYVFTPPAHCN